MSANSSIEMVGTASSRGHAFLTRRELVLWVIVCLLANHALHTLDTTTPIAFLNSLASQNLIYWFACYVVVSLIIDSSSAAASTLDISMGVLGAAGVIVSAFVGYQFGVGVLTTVASAYLLAYHRSDPALRAGATVLLAISIHVVWAPIIFRFFSPYILLADAATVEAVLSFIGPDIILTGTTFQASNGHAVSLVGACSSFTNLSIAVLGYVAMTMLVRGFWIRSDIYWAAAVCIAMIVLNASRLGVLALNSDAYQFWHDAEGAQYIALLQTAVVGVLSYLGASATAKPR